jgi:hypothetical protein
MTGRSAESFGACCATGPPSRRPSDAAQTANDSLTSAELQRRAVAQGLDAGEGRYVGTIAAVTEERCYNRFKGQHAPQLAITFADDERCILNKTMGRTLVNLFGAETDGWVGRCICIFLRPGKRVDAATGRPQLERVVMAAAPVRTTPDDDEALVEALSESDNAFADRDELDDTAVARTRGEQ